jgi:hypothetical protein
VLAMKCLLVPEVLERISKLQPKAEKNYGLTKMLKIFSSKALQ